MNKADRLKVFSLCSTGVGGRKDDKWHGKEKRCRSYITVGQKHPDFSFSMYRKQFGVKIR